MMEYLKLAFFLENVFQRTLKQSESEYIKLWASKQIPLWDIVRAYGVMMKKCEKPSFLYMAKILENEICDKKEN